MTRVLTAWLVHALVLFVVLRGAGAFVRATGATTLVGIALATGLAIAAATLATGLLLRSGRLSPGQLLRRYAVVPGLGLVLTSLQVVGSGGSGADLLLVALAWVGGTALAAAVLSVLRPRLTRSAEARPHPLAVR